jgi:hypothetical protein
MRVSKPEKLASARKNVTKQDDSADAGFFALGGPRRFSDREDDGGSDPSLDDKTQIEKHHLVDGSHPRKSGNGSSSWSKDKNRNFNSEFENEVKVSNSFNAQAPACEVKPTNCKNKAEVKLEIKSEENQNKHVDKDSAGHLLSDNSKRENQLNVGGPSCADVKVDATRNHDTVSTAKQSVEEPSSGRAQNETLADCPYPNPGSHEGNRANMLAVNAPAGDNELKGLKQNREVDHPNGMHHHHSSSRNASSNGHRVRDHDAPGAVKRDSFSQAANNALKEAKNLKHMADRLKVSNVYLLRICFL